MDSLSQIALGAAVSVAVMGRRSAVWKAALWGTVAGTLPDLDVLIDQGDAVRNMVLHRAETHSLFWLTLFSLPFSMLVARLSSPWPLWPLWQRWWLALWLALVTHPLLDAMTVYGTQLGLPFTNHPYGVGSVFIIDPLYTLPLLIGVGWALAGGQRALRANAVGLVLSCTYLAWGVAAQQHVSRVASASLAAQGVSAERVLVTPTAFNTLLWRAVAVSGDSYYEGFYSLLDSGEASRPLAFDRYARGNALADELQTNASVQRIRGFSKGFFALREEAGRVLISDLRMGQQPNYIFTFALAEKRSAAVPLAAPEMVGGRGNLDCLLAWLGPRIMGKPLPPPARFCTESS